MGNTSSTGAALQQRSGVQDLARKQGSKSWAITDHTISGPWSFIVKEHVQCLCEGGKNCTRENPTRQKDSNAVPGLHSNWVGNNVLAMARPWQDNITKYDVVSKFKELNIGMVLNLQEVGEHDSCGPGNLSSTGFTYNYELFTNAGIAFCNMSWRDMGVPTLDKMMDIVQIMHHTTAVDKKKIAVHCHAGLGRTGLAVACFLVASGEASAAQAIETVRRHRPGSLQTKQQLVFVSIFEQYLQHLRCLFKVADLRQLSLGNENYILTRVSRKISRSLSAHNQNNGDPMAAATAALNRFGVISPPSTADASPTKQPAALIDGQAASDWTTASFEPMTAEEAAQIPSAAEAAANAALNIGTADGTLVQHAKRLSAGGGNMKLVCNLKAIKEDPEKPVHVIETDNAVTEVYGHGLTIIRSAQSAKRLQAAAPRPTTEQLVMDRLPTATDLGLDSAKPWSEKFHVKPEAYVAEGWLPEAPTSYLEALRRQQRLLHGVERRRSLRLHKVLKAAAKALTKGGQAYNAVSEHWDNMSPASTAGSTAGSIRKCHSRSRSSAAAELLALTANIGTTSSGGASPHSNSSSGGGSLPVSPAKGSLLMSSGASAAAAAFRSGPGSNNSSNGGFGTLLPAGIHFGAPSCSCGTARVSDSAVSRCTSSNCVAGCCAPSFAAGLLAALLYKGRYPDEHKLQWGLCPRLHALGFAEGPSICSQLQTVKLALNAGDYRPLEEASAAVAVVVLGDWFEGFTTEALTENTLELLMDDADLLLAEALSSAEARQTVLKRVSDAANGHSQQQGSASKNAAASAEQADDVLLARRASARGVCCALSAPEQDLFLLLAAVLRHVRLASIDDSRLQSRANSGKSNGETAAAQPALQGSQAPATPAAQLASLSQQQLVVDTEVDAAMVALCKVMASWLLGPLAVACTDALDAVQSFLQYLMLDDIGYSQLLQATREQGIKKSHSQPAVCGSSGSADSLEGLLTSNASPVTPRSQLKTRLLGGLGVSPSAGGVTSSNGLSKSKLGHTASSPQLLKKGEQQADKLCGDGIGDMGLFMSGTDSVAGVTAGSKCKKVHIQLPEMRTAVAQQPQQQQPASLPSPPPAASADGSHCDDKSGSSSSSQLIQEGSSQLCVGRQKERTGVAIPGPSSLADELAGLSGQRQQPQQDAVVLTGSLESPCRSISPVPPSSSRNSNAAGRHHHLPAIRSSGSGATIAAAAGFDSNTSSNSVSPLSSKQFSPGRLSSLANSGPQQGAATATADAAGNPAGNPAAATAAGGILSAVPSSMPSSVDVAASQMLSVSMLSDIQLPSFPSSMSVAESVMMQGRMSQESISGFSAAGKPSSTAR